MSTTTGFDYDTAFSRNIGLLSESEQMRVKDARVGLAGLGGVGGGHLQALARMGVGAFHLADPDFFEMVNINRQMGASMPTVGRPKADVMAEMAHQINPAIFVTTFKDGITGENIADFLKGVDVVVDGLDFFCMDARRLLYGACRQAGIPIVNAGPMGYGAAVLVFMPDGPSFEEYFGIEDGMTRAEQLLAMGMGLVPTIRTDIDGKRMNLEERKGPALASTCMLCSAAAATEVMKILCGRGRTSACPQGVFIDLYRSRTLRLRRRPSLKRSLRGRLMRWIAFRRYPAFRRLHEREVAARGDVQGVPVPAQRPV